MEFTLENTEIVGGCFIVKTEDDPPSNGTVEQKVFLRNQKNEYRHDVQCYIIRYLDD